MLKWGQESTSTSWQAGFPLATVITVPRTCTTRSLSPAGQGRGDRGVLGIGNTGRARVSGQRSPQGPHHRKRGGEGGTEGSPGTLAPAGQGRGDRGTVSPAGWRAGSSAGSPPGAAAGLGTSGSAWLCDRGPGGDTEDPWGAGGTGTVSQSVPAEHPSPGGPKAGPVPSVQQDGPCPLPPEAGDTRWPVTAGGSHCHRAPHGRQTPSPQLPGTHGLRIVAR